MKIHVDIERLVLDGLPLTADEGAQVQAALEAELTRLLAEGSPVRGWRGAVAPRLEARPVRLGRGARPAEIGRQVAASVFDALCEPRETGGKR